jgi:hypothetical protein
VRLRPDVLIVGRLLWLHVQLGRIGGDDLGAFDQLVAEGMVSIVMRVHQRADMGGGWY